MGWIVYGPHGCGKTRNINKIRKFFCNDYPVLDDDNFNEYANRELGNFRSFSAWQDAKFALVKSRDIVVITNEYTNDLKNNRRAISFDVLMRYCQHGENYKLYFNLEGN